MANLNLPRPKPRTFAQAEVAPGAWKLPENSVWNVPAAPTNEVGFEIETWPTVHQPIKKLAGLAIDNDGRVYGWRTLTDPREDGYVQRGRVSVCGRVVKAFTGSKLFERPDGSLCNVAVLHCHLEYRPLAGDETIIAGDETSENGTTWRRVSLSLGSSPTAWRLEVGAPERQWRRFLKA